MLNAFEEEGKSRVLDREIRNSEHLQYSASHARLAHALTHPHTWCIALLCLCCAFAATANGATKWQVGDAPIRFRVAQSASPSIASAGYFVRIPDGGLLPGPAPISTVIDSSGNEIDSYCLYHNRKHGFVVLYKKPTFGDIYVYVKGGKQLRLLPPKSGLTPSMLFYIQTGRAAMDAAKKIPMGRAGNNTQFRRHLVSKGDPLTISSDLTRQLKERNGRPYSSRLSGYLVTSDPGRTWIAPMVFFGRKEVGGKADLVEVHIDGRRISAAKASRKSGGSGQWIELKKGLHKLDIYHANNPRGEFSNFSLGWRTPKTSIGELGGTRPDDLPLPGTSMWAARKLRGSEVVRSGQGIVRSAEARDGSPVAFFKPRAVEVSWFGNEEPHVVYEMNAITGNNPKDTVYTWQLNAAATIEDTKSVSWMYPWFQERMINLSATSGDKHSTYTFPLFVFQEGLSTDLNNPSARQAFRDVYYNMIRAYPPNQDPTAKWNERMWQTFILTLEPGTSRKLLAEIFGTGRWESMKAAISPERMQILENAFYQWFSYKSPEKCKEWLALLRKREKNAHRRKSIDLMTVEIYMYYLDDLKEARKILLRLTSGTGRLPKVARIRLGDIEFLKGEYSKAVELYGQVQDRVKHGVMAKGEAASAPRGRGLSSADFRKKREERRNWVKLRGGGNTPDWRIGAVRQAAGAEAIRKLIDEGYLTEADKSLQDWELEFPLTKFSGNYIVLEAKFFVKIGNYARARKMLEAYANAVDMTNDLPDALRMIADCMVRMKEPNKKIHEFVKGVEKRLPNHSISRELRTVTKYL